MLQMYFYEQTNTQDYNEILKRSKQNIWVGCEATRRCTTCKGDKIILQYYIHISKLHDYLFFSETLFQTIEKIHYYKQTKITAVMSWVRILFDPCQLHWYL